jgi:two-component system NtrC family sensor kinase
MGPSPLRWRIVLALLSVSLIPLCLLGVGAWLVFGRMLEDRALAVQKSVVERHAGAIDSYLAERLRLLQLLAGTHTERELAEPERLRRVLDDLNGISEGSFVDLGVIDAEGRHLAYAGPFDLAGRNYRDTDWFGEVMSSGVFISDVFLGFRQIPHCIIAVKVKQAGVSWLLRATINSEQFDRMVATGNLGQTAEAFIINREGLYQTRPREGSVLDRAPFAELTAHEGLRSLREEVGGRAKIVVTTWVNGGRWLLVVLRDMAEVREPVTRAMTWGFLEVLVAIVLVVTTAVLATRHLTRQIDKANRQREEIFSAFMRSAKLASVGELATGLAHEINNPLAIISAQQTNISDLIQRMDEQTPGRQEVLSALERTQRQVQRCGGITAKMLQFGRKQETSLGATDIKPRLRETVALLERQAKVANVELTLDVEPALPAVTLDPVELEQVLVNLIKNALDALTQGGRVQVVARRIGDAVVLEVRDDGPGVPPEYLPRLFEPFFTTKPVGKGTGLGLAVCYGLVQSWGGTIEAESEPGCGTVMRIRLPLQ